MKRIPILLILGINVLSAQDLRIVYHASVHSEFAPTQSDSNLGKTIYSYSLTIDGVKSKYSRDSLILYHQRRPEDSKEIWARMDVYKDHASGKVKTLSSEFTTNCSLVNRIENKLEHVKKDWIKTGREKEILGFFCTEFSSNQDTVWVFNSYLVNDGPQHGLFNLQGLVLYYKSDFYVWEAVNIVKGNFELKWPQEQEFSHKSEIRRSYSEILDLDQTDAILVNSTTPLNNWITFNRD